MYRITDIVRRSVGLVAVSAMLLTGCAPGAWVDLATVFDTEANDILTSQVDITQGFCGIESQCVQALDSQQARILKFANADAARDELIADDALVNEVFIVRWAPGAATSSGDRLFVVSILETAHSSN